MTFSEVTLFVLIIVRKSKCGVRAAFRCVDVLLRLVYSVRTAFKCVDVLLQLVYSVRTAFKCVNVLLRLV
jgi:hypothetical protein